MPYGTATQINMLRTLTVLYVLLLAVIVVGADLGVLNLFSGWLHRVPYGDKTCHFVFVGLMSFFVSASLSMHLPRKRKRTTVLATILVLVVLTSLEEFSQSVLTHRRFSEMDMLANIAGTCVFGSFALLLAPTKSNAESQTA